MTSTDLVPTAPAGAELEHVLFHDDTPLTEEMARLVTTKIRAYSTMLHRLVHGAYTRRVWEPLGYRSWRAYVAEELDMSQSRAYQLIDYARVQDTLNAAAATDDERAVIDQMPEGVARHLAPFRNDDRALRIVWAHACRIAGSDQPTSSAARAAACYWHDGIETIINGDTRLIPTDIRAGGDVYLLWTTPSDGVVLHVGLTSSLPASTYQHLITGAAWSSPPRAADWHAQVDTDLACGLVARLVTELYQVCPAMPEVVERVHAGLERRFVDDPGRGPHCITADEIEVWIATEPDWEDTTPPAPPVPSVTPPADDEIVDAEIVPDQVLGRPPGPGDGGTGGDSPHTPPVPPAPTLPAEDWSTYDTPTLLDETSTRARTALDTTDPGVARAAAAACRAMASRFEDRAAALARQSSLLDEQGAA